MNTHTAVVKEDQGSWHGWVEEVPGVNAQEASRKKLMVMNRHDAREAAESDYSEEPIAL